MALPLAAPRSRMNTISERARTVEQPLPLDGRPLVLSLLHIWNIVFLCINCSIQFWFVLFIAANNHNVVVSVPLFFNFIVLVLASLRQYDNIPTDENSSCCRIEYSLPLGALQVAHQNALNGFRVPFLSLVFRNLFTTKHSLMG